MARRSAANIAWVRNQLGADVQHHTAAEILAALNEAQRDVARRAHLLTFETRDLVAPSAGVEVQDLVEDSEGAHRLHKAVEFRWPDTFTKKVEVIHDPKVYEEAKLLIGTTSGQPQIMLFVTPTRVQLWPTPEVGTTWAVYGAWYPHDMEDDDNDPELGAEWDFAMRLGALYFLTGSPDAKARFDERFNTVSGANMNPGAGSVRVKHSSDRLGF